MRFKFNTTRGFSIVEIVLASSILGLIVLAVLGSFLYSQQSSVLAGNRNQALFLAEEGLEAARNIRDGDFANLSAGTYGLDPSGSEWAFSGTSGTQGLFTRQLVVADLDASTKQVTSTVTWQQNAQRSGSVSLTTYLTYWMEEVVLDTIGDWGNASQIGTLDLAGSNDGWRIQSQGNYAYLTRSGGNPGFAVINLTNSSAPSLSNGLSFSAWPRDLAISENYAYVASRESDEELKVIDISDPNNISQVSGYDLPGSAGAEGLSLAGSLLYMSRINSSSSDEIAVLDMSDPLNPLLLGSVDLGVSGYDLIVLGNYAYSLSNNSSAEVTVVDISESVRPFVVATYDLPDAHNAISVQGVENTLFVGRSNGDVVIIEVSDPLNESILATYQVGDDVRDMTLGNENKYLFVGSDVYQNELRVIDVSDPSNPTFLGGVDVTWDLNGVAYNNDLDLVIGASDDNSGELAVFAPS